MTKRTKLSSFSNSVFPPHLVRLSLVLLKATRQPHHFRTVSSLVAKYRIRKTTTNVHSIQMNGRNKEIDSNRNNTCHNSCYMASEWMNEWVSSFLTAHHTVNADCVCHLLDVSGTSSIISTTTAVAVVSLGEWMHLQINKLHIQFYLIAVNNNILVKVKIIKHVQYV